MNVFSYLNIPVRTKVVQLVRNFEDREKQITKHFEDGGELWAQRKKDGVYAMCVITEAGCAIFGRTGKKLQNVQKEERALASWADKNKGTGVLIAELCNPLLSLEQLSGIVNPNRTKPLSEEQSKALSANKLYFHDLLEISEFILGESLVPYVFRYSYLFELKHELESYPVVGSIIDAVPLRSLEGCEKFADGLVNEGEEGAVFKDPAAGWVAGRKNEVATKIVRGVDYDLEVLGVVDGKGKHKGIVSKLVVAWRQYGDKSNPTVKLEVDGRFDYDLRKYWWENPDEIIGKIVHVHALQLGSKGSLRLPKVRAVRIDKTEPDL